MTSPPFFPGLLQKPLLWGFLPRLDPWRNNECDKYWPCPPGKCLWWLSVCVYSMDLITLQGFPPAITLAGISLVTTLPAPITLFSPIVTPFKTVTFTPSHTLLPICIVRDGELRGSSR